MADNTFDVDDEDLVVSVANGRAPTLKDLAAKIKQLEGENFQLRVRIYMSEQSQAGGDPSKFDPKSKDKLAEEFLSMKKELQTTRKELHLMKNERDELLEKYNAVKSGEIGLETKMAAASVKENDKKDEDAIAKYTEKLASMTKALVDMGAKYTKLEEQHKVIVEQYHGSQKALQEKDDENRGMKEELTLMRLKNEELFRQVRDCQETIHKLNADMNVSKKHCKLGFGSLVKTLKKKSKSSDSLGKKKKSSHSLCDSASVL